MPKCGVSVDDAHQPQRLRRPERCQRQSASCERVVDRIKGPHVIGGQDTQCLGGPPRLPRKLPTKRLPDGVARRQGFWKRVFAPQLRIREEGRHLEQRKWGAAGQADQPLRDVLRDVRRSRVRAQELNARIATEPDEAQLGDRPHVEPLALEQPRRHDDSDPIRGQPTCDEQERLGGGSVDPLDVVDEKQDGSILGGDADEAQEAGECGEAVRDRFRADGDCGLERGALLVRHLRQVPS